MTDRRRQNSVALLESSLKWRFSEVILQYLQHCTCPRRCTNFSVSRELAEMYDHHCDHVVASFHNSHNTCSAVGS